MIPAMNRLLTGANTGKVIVKLASGSAGTAGASPRPVRENV